MFSFKSKKSKEEPAPPQRGPVNDRYARSSQPSSSNQGRSSPAPTYTSNAPSRAPSYSSQAPQNEQGQYSNAGPAPSRYDNRSGAQQPARSSSGSAYGNQYSAPGPPPGPSRYDNLGGPPTRSLAGGAAPLQSKRTQDSYDENRAALFAGGPQAAAAAGINKYASVGDDAAPASDWRSRRYNADGTDKFAQPSGALQDDGQEDLDDIKAYTKSVKQDSLQSTRESLRIILETQELARGTMVALGDQSDMIADTERALDQSKAYTNRAQDKIGEINLLNSSIFNPVAMARLNFNKDEKRRKQELKMSIRHDEEEARQISAMTDAEKSRRNLNSAMSSANRSGNAGGPVGYRQQALAAKQRQQSQYQFEADDSDQELEDEMTDNVNQIGSAVSNLKLLAGAMGTEIDKQTERLTVVTEKARDTDMFMKSTTTRMNRI